MVTILSIFNGGSSLLEDGGEGGQGSGFVLDGNGYIATNAHVVTTEGSGGTKQADQVYVEFLDGNRVPAEIVGHDPNADVALLKVDPDGLSLTPLHLGESHTIAVGEPVAAIGSPFGERQSLSIGVISALDRTIQSLTQLRDRRRDPDRRRDQPGQLRRTAARRARAGDRHQRADQVAVRRRRGRGVRDPGGRGAPLAARAARQRDVWTTATWACRRSRSGRSSPSAST